MQQTVVSYHTVPHSSSTCPYYLLLAALCLSSFHRMDRYLKVKILSTIENRNSPPSCSCLFLLVSKTKNSHSVLWQRRNGVATFQVQYNSLISVLTTISVVTTTTTPTTATFYLSNSSIFVLPPSSTKL